jgi:hypothetical protein
MIRSPDQETLKSKLTPKVDLLTDALTLRDDDRRIAPGSCGEQAGDVAVEHPRVQNVRLPPGITSAQEPAQPREVDHESETLVKMQQRDVELLKPEMAPPGREIDDLELVVVLPGKGLDQFASPGLGARLLGGGNDVHAEGARAGDDRRVHERRSVALGWRPAMTPYTR